MYSHLKVNFAAQEAFHLIKLFETYRDSVLPAPEPIYKKIEKNLYRIPPNQLVRIVNKSSGRKNNMKSKGEGDDEICLCGQNSEQETVCQAGSGCFNRDTSIECNDTNCTGGSRCQNRMFSTKTGQNDNLLEHIVSPGTKGWGLRTKCSFDQGSFLCEYLGEIISKEEVMWRVERKCDDDPLYYLEINANTFIDAEYYGNVSRLINHSCNPNCKIEKYYSGQGKPVVGIFAKRDINEGEELTFDYNYVPKSTFVFECCCKSKNCIGIIGRPVGNEENLVPNKKKTDKSDTTDWESEDECSVCGTRGELLMCDFTGCPKAYHLQCLGIASTPKGKWNCPQHHQEKGNSGNLRHPPSKKPKLTPRI